MKYFLVGLGMALAVPCAAQEIETFDDFIEFANGLEVRFTAQVGQTGFDKDFGVHPDNHRTAYFATLAVDREVVKSLSECDIPMFGEGNCRADIAAEIDFSDGRLKFLVFGVDNLEISQN